MLIRVPLTIRSVYKPWLNVKKWIYSEFSNQGTKISDTFIVTYNTWYYKEIDVFEELEI